MDSKFGVRRHSLKSIAVYLDNWPFTAINSSHSVNVLASSLHNNTKADVGTTWQGDLRRGLQTAVSQNKRRFIDTEAKFDLDLTYICDRMIAMALPCVDGAMYRNDIREVARFFSTRHYGVLEFVF